MTRSSFRRLIATVGALAALSVVGVGSATAAPMPAKDPAGYAGLSKSGTAKRFNVFYSATLLGGDPYRHTYSDATPGGVGAVVTVGRAKTRGFVTTQVITIRPTKVGKVTSTITNAFATLSGGDYGSTVIRSTSLRSNGGVYTVRLWFNNQGANADLNLRFYLYHS